MPTRWRNWSLTRDLRGHLFHSPNYFLPEQVEAGISTVHDLSVFKYPETHPVARVRHFEEKFAATLKRSVHLITDSEATRKEVIDYFNWHPDRITAIPLGAPPEFYPRSSGEESTELAIRGLAYGEYALCVSTLEPRKRIDLLIAAYQALPAPLRARYPLILAGSSGWLSDAIQEQIRRGEQEGWLKYLGFVSDTFLPILYAGARAFIFPSTYEGFGLPVLEAMASGVPTLVANCSSLPEVAAGAAWLAEPGSLDSLREGILHVLGDEEWRMSAIKRGLDVASRATWAKCAESTLQLCRRFA
ncbi:alpha-1,3-rhamnosyl/mannosyltransferase [Paraburkholderia bryophila]|uniref:Alpha-1,3-rhamnosyl/mannosyltransferase n=2 Tax=Paraburkholderia bryophila TaxID=420952 RepID=A0A329BLA0_9BURK|nr:alpha-1,3-rhamnosyl/mannosyltransferase [Paraburkholderia bryophila]